MNRKRRVFWRRRFFKLRSRRSDEKTLKVETNLKIVRINLKWFDLIKFRFALNINFDRKYREARSFDSEFRDKSFDLIKFRFELNINFDRKYYKSKSRDSSFCMSSQNEKKSRSIKNKKKLLTISKKNNNSLSRLTTINVARIIKQEFAKHVKIFNFFLKLTRENEVKFFKKNDFVTFVQALKIFSRAKMYTIYKRKNQKIKLSDICVSNDFKSDDDVTWKKNIMLRSRKEQKWSLNQW